MRRLLPAVVLAFAAFLPPAASAEDAAPPAVPAPETPKTDAPPPPTSAEGTAGETTAGTGAKEDAPKAEAPKSDAGKSDGGKSDAGKRERPKTVVATKAPFTVTLEVAGVFEPLGAAEVSYEPEAYGGELEVVEAFRGGPVEKDQVLVRFATKKIDEQLEVLARDVEIARRTLARQQEEAKKAQAASDGGLARATLERDRAAKALQRFVDAERAIRTRDAELRLKGTEDSIKDQEEELAQLEKMYGAGDAVEETERIVLARARRQLERSRIGLEFQRSRHKWFVETELPTEQRSLELGATKEALELERAVATAALALEQSRLELARAEAGFVKQEKALADLRRDRDALVLKAPRAGLAVPGACLRGKWSGTEETLKELEPGGKLRAKTPIFTVVEPGAVSARTAVGEAKVLSVKPGAAVELRPAADDKTKLTGRVRAVAPVASDGNFPVAVDVDGRDARFLPGFAVKLRILVREAKDVVALPVKCVGGEGDERFVHVLGEDDAPVRRDVKLGDTSDGKVEIVEGLVGDERVLSSPPK
jgi:hypothetical protein